MGQLEEIAERIVDLSALTPDSAFATDPQLQDLLGEEMLDEVKDRVAEQLDDTFPDVLSNWEDGFDRETDPEAYLAPLYEAIENMGYGEYQLGQISEVEERLNEIYREVELKREYDDEAYREEARVFVRDSGRSIFDDVDA